MQLAMLAPYNNLATSVAATLVPTLLGAKMRSTEENTNASKSTMETLAEESGERKLYTLYKLLRADQNEHTCEI